MLLLVLSNAVQNAMNGGDNSVGGGLISAVTLVLLNYLIGMATYRSKAIEALIEGRPDVIIHNGTLYPSVMKRAKLTHHELNTVLRQAGCSGINDVHTAGLENNGALSVVPKSRAEKKRSRWSSAPRATLDRRRYFFPSPFPSRLSIASVAPVCVPQKMVSRVLPWP